MKKNYLISMLLGLVFISCTNEISPSNELLDYDSEVISVNGGRLQFSSSAFFKETVSLNQASHGMIAKESLAKLTMKGFYSHRPNLSSEDNDLIKLYSSRLSNEDGRLNNIEIDESLISDDDFAIYLNEALEIQVGDSIYKYTEDGLYFVHADDLDHLYDYLANKSSESSGGRFAPCEEQLSPIDDKIMLYIVEDDCGGGTGGGTGGGNPLPPPPPSLPGFISTLKDCNGRDGTFSWIFGDAEVCEDFFDDKNKIKTKFWNQSYFFMNSIGLSVKSRKKTLGIWLNKKIPELGYGVSQANFRYNLPVPDYSYLEDDYIFKGTRYDKNGLPKGSAVPAWPFKSPLEVYIKLPMKSLSQIYTAEELNKMFWEVIWDQAKSVLSGLNDDNPKDVTMIAADNNHIYVVYVNLDKKEYNSSKINKVFDWNGQIKFTFGAASGYSPQVKTISGIYDYSEVNVDFYGYGYKDYTYRGSRMIFTD